jgi:hypothetical protein
VDCTDLLLARPNMNLSRRMENIGAYHEKLKTLVGEEQAVMALAQALEQAGDETK